MSASDIPTKPEEIVEILFRRMAYVEKVLVDLHMKVHGISSAEEFVKAQLASRGIEIIPADPCELSPPLPERSPAASSVPVVPEGLAPTEPDARPLALGLVPEIDPELLS